MQFVELDIYKKRIKNQGHINRWSMSLAWCQSNPIDVNFHLQKSLESFDKNSADKVWSKKDRGWKVPFLMPISVNFGTFVSFLDGLFRNRMYIAFCSAQTAYV